MFISVKELELRKLEYSESFAPGAVDFGPDIEQRGPLKSKGRAELIEENHGGKVIVRDIRVVGDFSAGFEMKCARCLEPVSRRLATEFDLLYRPLAAERTADEVEIHAADVEIGFYQGEGIMLEDVLKEQALLELPLKALCQEDCKGICPQCGQNRNSVACDCAPAVIDPRWSALAEIKNKLKQ